MSSPAALAAVPGLIRATRLSVEENAPRGGAVGVERTAVIFWLLYAEIAAEMLVERVPDAASAPRRAPQRVHAPLAENVEPLVPRWSGHDPRLPLGRPHP